jgi:glyoxylase I family protein
MLGVSHVMLSVTDLPGAKHFWSEVMGLEVAVDREPMLVCVLPGTEIGIACIKHPNGSTAAFDERRVGLDHLAFRVRDLETLRRWEQRFGKHDVPYTPIVESAWGWHLNARAPENVVVEIETMKPEVFDALFRSPGSAQRALAELNV